MYFLILNCRIKLIRKECSKRWPGNNKVYFRSNNVNSLILSEMVSTLEPLCTVKQIGFGQSKLRFFIKPWPNEVASYLKSDENLHLT